MKKLIVAAVLASSMVAMAEDTEVKKAAETAPVAAEQAVKRPKRGPLTDEQRAEMRARYEKKMAERKAEMEKKGLEIIKKYGLDDEKAMALMKELQEAMRPARRPRPPMKPMAKSAPKAE